MSRSIVFNQRLIITARRTEADHVIRGAQLAQPTLPPRPGLATPHLLPKQRREVLLQWVRAAGGIRISDVTGELGVSNVTIRRDIEVLARDGLIEQVHGGATGRRLTGPPGGEENRMGAAAARFVRPGGCVALAAGDACLAVAGNLASIPDITIVTNSTRVIDVLAAVPGTRTVILVGGQRTAWDAVVGPLAEQIITSMHFDVAILGAWGVDPSGVTAPDLSEAHANRRFAERSQRVIVLADSAKWGRSGIGAVATFDDIDVLITDRPPQRSDWLGRARVMVHSV
jgi:DeoR/GlpR family transcriptional regulator of sugar metabolism